MVPLCPLSLRLRVLPIAALAGAAPGAAPPPPADLLCFSSPDLPPKLLLCSVPVPCFCHYCPSGQPNFPSLPPQIGGCLQGPSHTSLNRRQGCVTSARVFSKHPSPADRCWYPGRPGRWLWSASWDKTQSCPKATPAPSWRADPLLPAKGSGRSQGRPQGWLTVKGEEAQRTRGVHPGRAQAS